MSDLRERLAQQARCGAPLTFRQWESALVEAARETLDAVADSLVDLDGEHLSVARRRIHELRLSLSAPAGLEHEKKEDLGSSGTTDVPVRGPLPRTHAPTCASFLVTSMGVVGDCDCERSHDESAESTHLTRGARGDCQPEASPQAGHWPHIRDSNRRLGANGVPLLQGAQRALSSVPALSRRGHGASAVSAK